MKAKARFGKKRHGPGAMPLFLNHSRLFAGGALFYKIQLYQRKMLLMNSSPTITGST